MLKRITWQSYKLHPDRHGNLESRITAGIQTLVDVKIQNVIFPGDTPTPLFFAIMIHVYKLRKYPGTYKYKKSRENIPPHVHEWYRSICHEGKVTGDRDAKIRIYNQYIRMEFGTEEYAMLIKKSGKTQTVEGIELTNQERIRTLGEKENYKY